MRGFSTITRVTPRGVGGRLVDIGSTRLAFDAALKLARGRALATPEAAPDAATPEAMVSSVARSISVAACCTFSSVEGVVD
jgi:hypothetical protein